MKRICALVMFLSFTLILNGFIISPAEPSGKSISQNGVICSRFENMLNNSYIYGDDFTDNEKLTNGAAIALCKYADDYGFIKSEIVSRYLKDMYDIDYYPDNSINKDFPQKDGFVYVIPRGYTKYNHKITQIIEYSDYFEVTSDVDIIFHDGQKATSKVISKFIKNQNSCFEYSIIDAVFIDEINNYITV